MRYTRDILMAELWGSIALALLISLLYETGLLAPGVLSEMEDVQVFMGLVMVLVVLAFIPLALYLFRLPRIRESLMCDESRAAGKLLLWGTVRMMMLCLPMVLCMWLYYAFGFNVRFFYLSLICALCLFMVYPTLGRCLKETGINSKAEDYDPNPTDDNPHSY